MTRLHFGANDVTSTEKGEGAHRVWLSGWSLVVLCLILPTHSYTQNSFDDLPILDLDTPIRMNFAGNWEKDFGRRVTTGRMNLVGECLFDKRMLHYKDLA